MIIKYPPPLSWPDELVSREALEWDEPPPLLVIDDCEIGGMRGQETFTKAFGGVLCVLVAGIGLAFAMLLL